MKTFRRNAANTYQSKAQRVDSFRGLSALFLLPKELYD